jgi:CRP-like cAMP-binding protein
MSGSTIETQALQNTPFFSGLPPEDIDGIIQVGQPVSFAAGDAIVSEGEQGDGMYIVVSGTAEVDVGGRFHKLSTGDFFGEMALVSAGKRMATVKATSPVEALKIPADAFQGFLLEHPRCAILMMRALVDRLREVEQRIDAWMAN